MPSKLPVCKYDNTVHPCANIQLLTYTIPSMYIQPSTYATKKKKSNTRYDSNTGPLLHEAATPTELSCLPAVLDMNIIQASRYQLIFPLSFSMLISM